MKELESIISQSNRPPQKNVVETLTGSITSVVVEKHEFGNRDMSILERRFFRKTWTIRTSMERAESVVPYSRSPKVENFPIEPQSDKSNL